MAAIPLRIVLAPRGGEEFENAISADINGMNRAELLAAEATDASIRLDIRLFFAFLVYAHFNGMHGAGAFAFSASDTGGKTDHGAWRKPPIDFSAKQIW